jgi:hypothetical protein
MTDAVTQTCQSLMRAVVRSGCIRSGRFADDDVSLATRVMREELKAYLFGEPTHKYADERALTLTGQSGLAMASLTAECIRRVLAERTP